MLKSKSITNCARASRLSLVAMFVGICSVSASAQTNIESNAGIQLDFANPGARSLGVGGAFVGLADDATAAFTNPAGLRLVSRKEVAVEGRHWSFTTPYTSGGRLSGAPSLQGIDQIGSLTTADSRRSTGGLSFLSFVYPRSRWAVAAYRQQLADFSYVASSDGPFVQVPSGDTRLYPYRATLDLKIARYGASASVKVGEDVSIGAGVYAYDFSLSSHTQRFNYSPLYAAPNFSATPGSENSQNGNDTRAGLNVGISATLNGRTQVGAVYRQGARFDLETTSSDGGTGSVTFTVPDVFSGGVAIRATNSLRVMLDYSRVRYSQITHDFIMFFAPYPGLSAQSQDFKVDAANEVHVGGEYMFLNLPVPLAIRAGAWYDPDHAIRFEPPNAQQADPYALAVFRKGKNVVHSTGGAGVVLGPVEFNAAGDFSSRTKTVSLSAVVRF